MVDVGLETVLAAVRQHGPEVAAYEELGAVKATLHPKGELLIFNYTQIAQFAGTWSPVERVCRGLIIHWPTATVRARGFDKFFNLSQMPETQITALPDGPMEVTEKVDGSLGILFNDGFHAGDSWAIATRGSFTSEQAIWATEHLHHRYDMSGLPEDVSLLFEIIYPENRIVLDYGERKDLVLIGARYLDGRDGSYADLQYYADTFGFPLVPRFEVESLEALAHLATQRIGEEGWVVRFADGFRVKLKTTEYLRQHAIITHTSSLTIWESLKAGVPLGKLLDNVPDEFYHWVVSTAEQLVAAKQSWIAQIEIEFAKVPPGMDRKSFAIITQRSENHAALFKLYDDKSIDELAWKAVKPTYQRPFNRNEEA